MSRLLSSFVAVVLLLQFTPALAQELDEVQRQCFAQLQQSIQEAPTFSPIKDEVKALDYDLIQNDFSGFYKNISSFGVDLQSPDFDMRIYSFGRETGYQHPPFSPFPTYTLSDKWEVPANEFIIAEEYVRNTETNERTFLSCSFMVVDTGSLKKVTAEKYLYDGDVSSVLYTAPDASYKAWYSKNKSYDHSNVEFVTWERLFIYPEATKNSFFDKYTVANAFPARVTNSLSNIVNSPRDLQGDTNLLNPPEQKGYDTVFALNSYYQAIENSFPEFSQKLSLRGVLQYDTAKELLATRGVPEFNALWNVILDPRDITRYALLKEKGLIVEDNNDGVYQMNERSAFYEEQLVKIGNLSIEKDAQDLLKSVPERNPIVEEVPVVESEAGFLESFRTLIIIGGLLLVAMLGGLLYWLRSRRYQIDNIS